MTDDKERRKKLVIFLPSVSVWISKIIKIWDGRQKVVVEIQKSLCGGIKIDNLIDSARFCLKIS